MGSQTSKIPIKVLIVSPHFPPTNAADMQRVRFLLPYFAKAGVEVEVLAVEPVRVAAPLDSWLGDGLPSYIPVHRVQALNLHWRKIPGLGSLSWRALGSIRRKGDILLGRGGEAVIDRVIKNFDLVYFSTTQFGIHVLGPHWKRKYGVPFVMDYQDPWVNDYYREHPEIIPPGGRFKYFVASWMNRQQEPKVLQECSGITSVSKAYPDQIANRYKWLKIIDASVGKSRDMMGESGEGRLQSSTDQRVLPSIILPFPGDSSDYERVKLDDIRQTIFDPNDGLQHWVYVGRGGADMAQAIRGIFSAVSEIRSKILNLRMHFIGTSYAGAGRGVKSVEPLAAEFGLQGIVSEHPDRIAYSEALRCLVDADALIIPGSNDPGYTASKIYPYLLAGRPLLAVFHEGSSVISLMASVGGGTAVSFHSSESIYSIGQRVLSLAFTADGQLRSVPLDVEAFQPFSASAQVAELARFFRTCLDNNLS